MSSDTSKRSNQSKFDPFTIHTTTYKVVYNQPITVDTLYPTALLSNVQALENPRPVILRFHGGGLVTGGSLFPDYFGKWLLNLAEKHNAIIVSPDYRLFPESSPSELLSDIADIWKWTQSSLHTYLDTETNSAIKIDLSRIITTGESAGGMLSLIMGLERPESIRAVMAQYPMIDLRSAHFTKDYDKLTFGMTINQFPRSLVTDLLDAADQYEQTTGFKKIVSSDPSLSRMPAMFSVLQHGMYPQFIDDKQGGEGLYIIDRLRSGQKFPRGGVYIWHGNDDSVVPVQGSHEFKNVLSQTDQDLKFNFVVRPGEHGFDADLELDDDWVRDMIAQIENVWLA